MSCSDRSFYMEHDLKVWAAAALLLERYGKKAPEVAQGWSRELTERHEPEAAARCLEIGDAANKMLTERAPLVKKVRRRRKVKRLKRPDHAA
jgi:hypothetical protein